MSSATTASPKNGFFSWIGKIAIIAVPIWFLFPTLNRQTGGWWQYFHQQNVVGTADRAFTDRANKFFGDATGDKIDRAKTTQDLWTIAPQIDQDKRELAGLKLAEAGRPLQNEYADGQLRDFAILSSNPSADEYSFQLDARVLRQPLNIEVSGGDEIDAYGDPGSVVCAAVTHCVGPNGQDGVSKFDRVRPNEFPVGDAFYQALVGYVGTHTFQIGTYRRFIVPSGEGRQTFYVGANIRAPEVSQASEGFRIKIKITKGNGG